MIPCQAETINAGQKCVFSLKGSAALREVVYLKDNKPNIEIHTGSRANTTISLQSLFAVHEETVETAALISV